MMSPEVSPAPSDVPVNKDGAGDEGEMVGLNLENGLVVNAENMESDESSDEDDDIGGNNDVYSGYVALEQQPSEEGCNTDGDLIASGESHHNKDNNDENHCDHLAGGAINADESMQTVTYSSNQTEEKTESTDISAFQITDTHAEVIKQAMAGFSLPTNNIPEWARVVPEENWKSKLMDSIAKKQ